MKMGARDQIPMLSDVATVCLIVMGVYALIRQWF